jgi:hypothetical protein
MRIAWLGDAADGLDIGAMDLGASNRFGALAEALRILDRFVAHTMAERPPLGGQSSNLFI